MDVQGIIANNIKQLRKSHGFTQQEIADLISIDISVYSRIEGGKTMASHDKLHYQKYIACQLKSFSKA